MKCWRVFSVILLSVPLTSAWVPSIRGTASRRTPTAIRSASSNTASDKPVLVVGATGRVGRLVVQELLDQKRAVRALVRDQEKFEKIFGNSTAVDYPGRLEVHTFDLGGCHGHEEDLDETVKGCSAIISVTGATRFAKLSDFLPWRIFNYNVSSWADRDRDHPYYSGYLGQKLLIQLAEKHGIDRFVRLSSLRMSYSAFNPVTILYNALLSFKIRWGLLGEQALAESKVPYVILRPGGLLDASRDVNRTHLQVDPSGILPFPGRCGRADVAALSVAALSIPQEMSYTLACQWCGDAISQGTIHDGLPTADECIRELMASRAPGAPAPKMKPYGVAVAASLYTLPIVAYAFLSSVATVTRQTIRGIFRITLKVFGVDRIS